MEQPTHHPHGGITEVTLSYNPPTKSNDLPKVSMSRHAYDLFISDWDKGTIQLNEQFKVMLLNGANRVLGVYLLSIGGLTGTVADPRLIFIAALKSGATSIILAHNHPSGNLSPSNADRFLTDRIREAGLLLDIKVADHIILSPDSYYSFADEGVL